MRAAEGAGSTCRYAGRSPGEIAGGSVGPSELFSRISCKSGPALGEIRSSAWTTNRWGNLLANADHCSRVGEKSARVSGQSVAKLERRLPREFEFETAGPVAAIDRTIGVARRRHAFHRSPDSWFWQGWRRYPAPNPEKVGRNRRPERSPRGCGGCSQFHWRDRVHARVGLAAFPWLRPTQPRRRRRERSVCMLRRPSVMR